MNLFNIKSEFFSYEGIVNLIDKNGERKIFCRISPPEPDLYHSKTIALEDCSLELELWLNKYGNHIVFFDKKMKIINDCHYIDELTKDDLIRNLIHVILEQKIEISFPEFLTIVIEKYCKEYQAKVLVAKPIPAVNKVRKILSIS